MNATRDSHLEGISSNLVPMFNLDSKMNWLEFGVWKSKVKVTRGTCPCEYNIPGTTIWYTWRERGRSSGSWYESDLFLLRLKKTSATMNRGTQILSCTFLTDSDSYFEGSFPVVVFVDNNVNSSDSASLCPGRMTGLSVHGNNDESGILQFFGNFKQRLPSRGADVNKLP